MRSSAKPNVPGFAEFVSLMAMMMALVALSTDAMLPALGEIGEALQVQQENATQLIVSFLFFGMALGQMFYGPLSDSFGRKPVIYTGYGIFIFGCLLAILANNYAMMLAGRLLQGVGAAGPRSVTIAIIRDRYESRAMARVMSFVMSVFILVPVIAPTIGQAVLLAATWRAIFGMLLILGLLTLIWFAVRQPETLPAKRRIAFSWNRIFSAVREVCTNRIALGYTLGAGFVSGAFLGYLNSAQQIFQVQYQLGRQFPIYFAIISLAVGGASFLNGRLVLRFGMRLLSRWAVRILVFLSFTFSLLVALWAGHPPLWLLMVFLLSSFFCVGILFGNLNALAMEPLGHIAGVGAAIVGSFSTFISVPLGTFIGQSYNGTVLPLLLGFSLLGTVSLIFIHWAGRGYR